ncbi:MAG: hypothetical protein ACQKBY_11155, partial [Verrucomicrobiales bacterium]
LRAWNLLRSLYEIQSQHKMSLLSKIQALACHLVIIVVSLLAAEVLCMLAIWPWMRFDQGAVVVMGLFALPLWATLLTLIYTADRRWRTVLILLAISLLAGPALYFFS